MIPGDCAACSTLGVCSAHREPSGISGELIVCYRCNGLGTVPDHHGEGRVQCPRCHDGAHLGEQSLSAEELEIDRLRADVARLEAELLAARNEAAAVEREACAELLERMAADADTRSELSGPLGLAARTSSLAARTYATAIRMRGDK